MYIKSEYKKIIEEIVRRNENFEEQYLQEICDTVYKKTYLILATKENDDELREYLRVVSHKIIIDVVRKNSVIKIQNTASKSTKRDFKEYIQEKNDFLALEEKIDDSDNKNNEFFDYVSIPDPLVFIRQKNQRKKMEKLIKAVYDIHSQMPDRLYYQIFYYKYCKNLSQSQVAKKVALSQGELSKRILELMQILKGFNLKF